MISPQLISSGYYIDHIDPHAAVGCISIALSADRTANAFAMLQHGSSFLGFGVLLSLSLRAAGQIDPSRSCLESGQYFDAVRLQCASCTEIDGQARLVRTASPQADVAILGRELERLGTDQCQCLNGFVQCDGGDECFAANTNDLNTSALGASLSSFVAQGPFQCRKCPLASDGQPMAPTQDRMRCLPCLVDQTDPETTAGYSDRWGDCVCPEGSALKERTSNGSYQLRKTCVKCAEGILFSPTSEPLPNYDCNPCPDFQRMYRQASTGQCICRQGTTNDGYLEAGGSCVSAAEFNEINDRFPETPAVIVEFRDLIDGRESWWQSGPFGQFLGIEARTGSTLQTLSLDSAGQDVRVTSAAMQWLYIRCGIGCLRGNATACQCISNLCVLQLYDDQATVCNLVLDLYQGKPRVEGTSAVQDMPWLYYSPQRPVQTLQDASLNWRYTFADVLVFWLASYSLEGSWLGWTKLESQLDPCASFVSTSAKPRSLPSAWRRFGSSLRSQCNILARSVLDCGANPVLYDLFVENTDGTLVPVPVRILNLVQNGQRPNLGEKGGDGENDVLVRRFLLCDAVSGRESGPGGPGQAYLSKAGYLRVVRWAAHLAVQVRVRPEGDGQVYVPVVSIAYAEKRTDNLQEDTTLPGSFAAEYTMDTSGYWTAVTVLFVLLLFSLLGLVTFRLCLLSQRYPNVPVFPDPHLFAPRLVLQVLVLCSTTSSLLFWFQYFMTLFWLIMFKGQNVPLLLLPSALGGGQYEAHDVMLVLVFCLAVFTVSFGLWKHLRVFFFLVDWEKPRGERETLMAQAPAQTSQPPPPPPPGGPAPPAPPAPGSQLVGAPLLSGGFAQGFPPSDANTEVAIPDSGISAWRTLFVCNELNERLSATRAVPEVTWLSMVLLLDGFNWVSAARWNTHTESELSSLAADLNPFLQFALGVSVWIFVLTLQFLLQRVGSIFLGHDLNDFVDVCSIANVSVRLDLSSCSVLLHLQTEAILVELCV